MSLNHIPIILLLLLLLSSGAGATESPMTTSADLFLPGTDPAPQSPDLNARDLFDAAPFNPEFITYQESISQARDEEIIDGHGLGAIPSPLYRPELTDIPMKDLAITEFNATFDLRDTGKVSAVRDQDGFGTCWAFGSYGSLESYLLPDVNRTFSPKNMVNRHGFDYGYNEGGHIYMSTAYLTRWEGPVDETTDPYPIRNWTASDSYPPVMHVQDVIFYPSRSVRNDTSAIKAGLQRWGAADVGFYWNNSFYNVSSAAYYQPADSPNLQPGGGHMVTIIGWNDTFPASAFKHVPPGDGAWILKNSWGTGWGDGGFFHVSYYDKYMGSAYTPGNGVYDTAFITAEPVNNYDQVYLHDPLGECEDYYIGEPREGMVATRFKANSSGIISAIGFFTNDVNTRYDAVIYRNAVEGPVGEEVARVEGNLSLMGYHTVKLPPGSEVHVNAGEYFSVVLSLENAEYWYPVALETPIHGYSSRATAAPGESYYYNPYSDSFDDLSLVLPNASACVRAYITSVPEPTPTPQILSASFTAKPVTGLSPLTVRFTDTSSGSPDRWFWSFGDGTQSLDQNPEKTYDKAGLYSVTLVVKKGKKIDQVSKRNMITVQNPAVER